MAIPVGETGAIEVLLPQMTATLSAGDMSPPPNHGTMISFVGAGGKTTLMFALAHELVAAGYTVLTTTSTRMFIPDSCQSSHVILSDSVISLCRQSRNLLTKQIHHITAAAGTIPDQTKLIGLPPEQIDALFQSRLFQWILVEADGAARMPLKAPAIHEPVVPNCCGSVIAVVGLDAVDKPLAPPWVFRPEIYARITGIDQQSPVTLESIANVVTNPNGLLKGIGPQTKRFVFLNKADLPGNLELGQRLARMITTAASACHLQLDAVWVGSAGKQKIYSSE